jgi:pimeloyl-ACP methyl ester carboxylesterase
MRTPTLILWGQHDALAPVAAGEALAALVPSAELRALDAGHNLHQERPGEVIDSIERWLS